LPNKLIKSIRFFFSGGQKIPLGWDDAIKTVLRDAPDGVLHYTDIIEKIAERRLRPAGANPTGSVAVHLSRSLQNQDSPFQRVGPGLYALRESLRQPVATATQAVEIATDESKTGALRAFGMYWRRNLVDWGPIQPELLGLQSAESLPVDFATQVGVYLLHDRDRVIYVGRATDRLVVRLRVHLTDRLGGRWDRFSWFGLLDVNEDGELVQENVPWTQTVVIETLEALLIESLEPPLNRRRGDNFSAVEYLQGVARRVDIADPGA
jgi:hypothetical protein